MINQDARIAILISGTGTNMFSIVEKLPENIAIIITTSKEESPYVKAVKERGHKVEFVDHRIHNSRESFEKQLVKVLEDLAIDLVCLAGFTRILTTTFLKSFPNTINIHPSLLPDFKGLYPVDAAFKAGAKQVGCTVHLVNEELDGGRILAQCDPIPVLPQDTAETLGKKVLEQEHIIYPATLEKILKGEIKLTS